jgi:hypothetical protein
VTPFLLRFLLVGFIAACCSSCNTQSPIFTPPKNDPAYHCRDLQGNVLVDSTWCYPTTGTHDCCDIGGTCLRNDPNGCEYPPVDNNYPDTYVAAKRRFGPRRPESPGVTP